MLVLVLWPLLVRHLLLSEREAVVSWRHLCHIYVHRKTPLLLVGHVENRRGLARVVDDDVVDVVVVDDVRDVLRSDCLRLNPLWLHLNAWLRTSAPHAESLTIRVSLTFQPPLILTLLRHRVFRQLLRTSKRSLLVITVAADKVVLLLVLRCTLGLLSLLLLRLIRTEDSTFAIAHVALACKSSFRS